MHWVRAASLFAALVCLPAHAGETWPQITGATTTPECKDAYRLAQAMFTSPAMRVYAPLQLPADMGSDLLLGASEYDISGGDALTSTAGFEKLAQHDGRSSYWEIAPQADVRLVLSERSAGWRGDIYTLFLPDVAVGRADYLRAVEADQVPYQAPIDSNWRPPLVFQLREGGRKWFIDVDQPFFPLSAWRVFGVASGRYVQHCEITFQPADGVTALLPKQLKQLLQLLDQTLGPGLDEGTLQPTARLRNSVQHVAANVALRPWAVSERAAYNNRQQVDAGLAGWAVNAKRKALLQRILRSLPKAEVALAAYYQTALVMPSAPSKAEARRVLDLLLRAHYVFAKP